MASDGLIIAQLAVLLVVVVAILRSAPKITDTVFRALSGEQGGLLPGGFMSSGTRLRRAGELQAIVSRLALITRLNLPLCPALDAAAVGEARRINQVLGGMSRRIRTGIPVSTALEAAFRGCPVQLTAILRGAEACGQLAQALADQERMIAATIDAHLGTTAHTRHAVAYATVMVLFAGCMISWVMVFLMPKFKDIFLDYNTALPRVTIALIEGADWLGVHLPEILVIVLLIVFGTAIISVWTRRMSENGILMRIVASVRWALPITRTLDYGLGMGKVIRSMALGIRSGAPSAFVETLPTVVSPTNHLRGRLALFARSISEGVAPHQAAKNANLGEVFVCALRMVERGEEPERALGHAADYYEAIAFRWWHALAALSGPLVTLALGFMVGFIALALFMPLIAMINAVSESL